MPRHISFFNSKITVKCLLESSLPSDFVYNFVLNCYLGPKRVLSELDKGHRLGKQMRFYDDSRSPLRSLPFTYFSYFFHIQ